MLKSNRPSPIASQAATDHDPHDIDIEPVPHRRFP
jgi:hypothetical protein